MAKRGKNSQATRARRAKSAELNKRYRHEASELKRLGVLTKRVNAHKNITHATRTKINKFRDVLEGKATAVRAPKDIRQKYEGILEARGGVLIVPKERAKERVKIARGLVEIERPISIGPSALPYGTESEVILPFSPKTMQELVAHLREDESLDGLKRPGELFSFRLDGFSARAVFPDARDMGDYIFNRYQHLFKASATKQAVKYISFVRFRGAGSDRLPSVDTGERKPMKWYKKGAKKRPDHDIIVARKLERDKSRKKRERAQESEQDKATRLAKQRVRSAQNRQRKFEEK